VADLPVQLPVKFDRVLKCQDRKAVGLTLLQSLPLRADELIK
jgi:hypothetical protein